MPEEKTSEKQDTEVFYDEPEVKTVETSEGEKETKPSDKEVPAASDDDKGESKKDSESEAEGEGEASKGEAVELKVEDLVVPTGSELNGETVKEIYAEAKELGMNKDQAQALLDAKSMTESSLRERAQAELESLKGKWLKEFKADPEIGGDKAPETAEHAKRAVEAFASDALRKSFDETGYGNSPEILRMLSKVGQKMLASDKFISGTPVTSGNKSTADLFYSET